MKNSEADSIFAFSTSFQDILKQLKSQVSSTVWTYCYLTWDEDDDLDSKLKYYTHCTTFSVYCTNISFNMWKHFKSWHKIDVEISVSQVQATILQ